MFSQTIKSEAELEDILSNYDTVVLDFWAEWCPPCKGFAPVFEAVAGQNTDIAFCRVNADEAPDLKQGFEVKSLPTLIVVRDRVLVASQPGYIDKSVLAKLVEDVRSLDMDAIRRQNAAD